MGPVERQQALSALLAAVTALFVASWYSPLARWRRRLRAAAVVAFLIALAAALAEVGSWLAGANLNVTLTRAREGRQIQYEFSSNFSALQLFCDGRLTAATGPSTG